MGKQSIFEKTGRGLKLKKALIALYERDELSMKNEETGTGLGITSSLDIFLHTHQVPFPIPLKKFITGVNWSETSTLNQANGVMTLRMPFNVFQMFFQGEGTEPSTGHWVSIRRQTQNPFQASNVEFKKRPMPKIKLSPIPSVTEIAEEAARQVDFEKQEEERLNRFNRKKERIHYEVLWLGQISQIGFSVIGHPGSGTSTYSDITLNLMNWEYPLKTSNYKIINANIDRAKQPNPDNVETTSAEQGNFSGIASSGGRFIIDTEVFKELTKAITQSVATAEDPKFGIKQILDVFAYMKLPSSIYKTNLSVRKLIKEVSEYEPPKTSALLASIVGTPEELDGSLDTVAKRMAFFGLTKLIDSEGRQYTQQEAQEMTLIVFKATFVDEDPNATVTVTGFSSPSMGSQIKVCTVLEDLPPSAGYLRQMLPTKLLFFKNVNRFKELLTQNGTAWTRILGSFVPDPNIIEFFPLIVHYTQEDLKSGWVPSGRISTTGFQLCLIWRIKPLRPYEFLDRGHYNDLIHHYNKKGNMWRELEDTNIQLKSEKIGDDDNNMTHSSLLLNTLHVESLQVNYREDGRCNGAYLEHPFLKSESNLKFGTLSQPVIDTRNAQHYGFKMFESSYPFMDASVKKDVRDALTERVYCTQRDEGEGASGVITMRGIFHHPMRPGMFCSLVFDEQTNASQGLQGVGNYHDNHVVTEDGEAYVDQIFTFMVNNISYNYQAMPDGYMMQQTIINYNRGKFTGLPTLLPIEHRFGRPQKTTVPGGE